MILGRSRFGGSWVTLLVAILGLSALPCARAQTKPPLLTHSVWQESVNELDNDLNSVQIVSDTNQKKPDGSWNPHHGEIHKVEAYPVRILPNGTKKYSFTTVAFYPALGVENLDITSTSDFPNGGPGRIIGQLANLGALHTVYAWSIEPATVYYVVAERDSDGELDILFLRPGYLPAVGMDVVNCHKRTPPGSQMTFKPHTNCDHPLEAKDFRQPDTGAPWFTCAQGCCMGGTVFYFVSDQAGKVPATRQKRKMPRHLQSLLIPKLPSEDVIKR
ncbi:MAG TPA: hypothetical protein VGJ18_02575 [Gemmatimonadaceae bacterium]|jgi:hypothetical protein